GARGSRPPAGPGGSPPRFACSGGGRPRRRRPAPAPPRRAARPGSRRLRSQRESWCRWARSGRWSDRRRRSERGADRWRLASRGCSLAEGQGDFNRPAVLFGYDLPHGLRSIHELDRPVSPPMTFALVGIAAVVFSILFGVVHTVSERRQQRRMQEQWGERERALNRKP